MDPESEVDLLGSLASISGARVIALTTFGFDPIFFDHVVLPKLQEKNPEAQIVVIADPDQLRLSMGRRTPFTGTRYLLVASPGHSNRSFFHPKVHVAVGGRVPYVAVGSHNLTAPGMMANLEVTLVASEGSIVQHAAQYAREVLVEAIGEHEIVDELARVSQHQGTDDEDPILIHNRVTPILDQIRALVPSAPTVRILAPFHNSVEAILERLGNDFGTVHAELLLAAGAHDVKAIPNPHAMSVSIRGVVGNRLLHGKIVELVDPAGRVHTLLGSANFTAAALLKTPATGGNDEACVLVRGRGSLTSTIAGEKLSTLPPARLGRDLPEVAPSGNATPLAALDEGDSIRIIFLVHQSAQVEVLTGPADAVHVTKVLTVSAGIDGRTISFVRPQEMGPAVRIRIDGEVTEMPIYAGSSSVASRLRNVGDKAERFRQLLALAEGDQELSEICEALMAGTPSATTGGHTSARSVKARRPRKIRTLHDVLYGLLTRRSKTSRTNSRGRRSRGSLAQMESKAPRRRSHRNHALTPVFPALSEAFRARFESSKDRGWIFEYLRFCERLIRSLGADVGLTVAALGALDSWELGGPSAEEQKHLSEMVWSLVAASWDQAESRDSLIDAASSALVAFAPDRYNDFETAEYENDAPSTLDIRAIAPLIQSQLARPDPPAFARRCLRTLTDPRCQDREALRASAILRAMRPQLSGAALRDISRLLKTASDSRPDARPFVQRELAEVLREFHA